MMFWTPFGLKPKKEEEGGPHYGDIYERSVAAAIDLWLLYLILNGVFRYIMIGTYRHADQALIEKANAAPNFSDMIFTLWQSGLFHLWVVNALIQVAIIGFFIVNAQILWGATPGKYLMGLRVVRRGTFEKPSNWRLLLRFIAYIPATLPLMLGIIWASFNKEHRGWHDMIAGTVVINTRPKGWYWQQAKSLPGRIKRVLKKESGPVE